MKWRKVMGASSGGLYNDLPDWINFNGKDWIGAIGLIMCPPIIAYAGTKEQNEKWVHKINNGDYVTAYAQTEIAHGSDVQGLQTTATWEPETQQWDIHTPTVEAYKWWPGDLAHTSNWAMV